MRLKSPAKINLFLKVLHKRSDGFHELETLFERIDLADEIALKKLPQDVVRIQCPSHLPKDSKNLAVAAAQILKEKCHVKTGVLIKLRKKIPIQAGLGGGSSNAATVLLGLNKLWKLKLSQKKLMALGATLGSDVPFFVLNTSFAKAHGRGEILKTVAAPKAKLWHCLVKPGFGISTKEAYQNLKLPQGDGALTPQKADVSMLVHAIQKNDPQTVSGFLVNSLEHSINKKVREIDLIKNELLAQGALGALMSGSGSTVFGIFKTSFAALKAKNFLQKKNKSWQVFVAKTY